MNKFKLYIAGSLANTRIPEYTNYFSTERLESFSEWYTPGPDADVYWREYEQKIGYGFLAALKRPAGQHIFNFDKKHIDLCDGMLLVGPAGKSGHLELGYVIGQGKPSAIFLPEEPEKWDVMYNFAGLVSYDMQEIREYFEGFNIYVR